MSRTRMKSHSRRYLLRAIFNLISGQQVQQSNTQLISGFKRRERSRYKKAGCDRLARKQEVVVIPRQSIHGLFGAGHFASHSEEGKIVKMFNRSNIASALLI
eukprot:COSAG02_NODE_2167_length_9609_cov_18.589485_4_plen_102_part_00